jgi:hypothetical protein
MTNLPLQRIKSTGGEETMILFADLAKTFTKDLDASPVSRTS